MIALRILTESADIPRDVIRSIPQALQANAKVIPSFLTQHPT
jgi:hypothetical protein